jgi:hypothetical protein
MMRSLLDTYEDVDHEAGDEDRTRDEHMVGAMLEKMEAEVDAEREDRARNKERLARIQSNYEAWAARPKAEASPDKEQKQEGPLTGNGAGSDEWWQASAKLDEGTAAVSDRRYESAILAYRAGLAIGQDDAGLKAKLKEGLSWAKLRLAAERKKASAEQER